MGLQICFDTLKVFCNNTMSTTNFDPASWTLLRGWDKVDKSYGVQPGDFPARPWILYCPETHHLYLSKRGQEDPPTDQWYQVYQGGDREPTEEPCLAVDIVGGTAQIRILQHTDASGEGPLPSTKPIPKPRSPVQKAWILRRGWDKVSESYGVQPSDFPVNPWVLYCPRTHHLYLSKSFQATPPTGQWYQLYQHREPTEEPCIAIEIVDGIARILDTREYTDARRFSGEECILVRDSEVPSDALETELYRRISSMLHTVREYTDARRFSAEPLPSDDLETELCRRISSTLLKASDPPAPKGAWTISDGLTAAQRLQATWKKDPAPDAPPAAALPPPAPEPDLEVWGRVTWDSIPETCDTNLVRFPTATFEPESSKRLSLVHRYLEASPGTHEAFITMNARRIPGCRRIKQCRKQSTPG